MHQSVLCVAVADGWIRGCLLACPTKPRQSWDTAPQCSHLRALLLSSRRPARSEALVCFWIRRAGPRWEEAGISISPGLIIHITWLGLVNAQRSLAAPPQCWRAANFGHLHCNPSAPFALRRASISCPSCRPFFVVVGRHLCAWHSSVESAPLRSPLKVLPHANPRRPIPHCTVHQPPPFHRDSSLPSLGKRLRIAARPPQ